MKETAGSLDQRTEENCGLRREVIREEKKE
jgi:hypothetical protein